MSDNINRAVVKKLVRAASDVLDYALMLDWLLKPGGENDVWSIRKEDLRRLWAAHRLVESELSKKEGKL